MSKKKLNKWMPYKAARKFIRSLGLQNDAEWRCYCKGLLTDLEPKPADIPASPKIIYANQGWSGLGDWLGTGKVSNRVIRQSYRPFREARKYARSLHLKNRLEWQRLYRDGKIPLDIPLKPERVYLNKGWISCGDWFGTGYVSPRQRIYRSFTEAREFANKLGLVSRQSWELFCKDGSLGKTKLPDDVPATPARIYKNIGWKGWPDWLGKSLNDKVQGRENA